MKVIVFDLDDTLYKEIDYLKSAFGEISIFVEKLSGQDGVWQFMMWCYNERKDVFRELNTHYNLSTPLEVYINMYRNHHPSIKLDTETERVLDKIQEMEYVIGMITDGRSITQRNKLKALGLDRYLGEDNIIISEEFGSSKDNISNFSYFAEKYPLFQFVYVGDNPQKDFANPNKLGWKTVCLLDDGQNIHKQVFEDNIFAPGYKIKNLSEIIYLV